MENSGKSESLSPTSDVMLPYILVLTFFNEDLINPQNGLCSPGVLLFSIIKRFL
jgi:hypothetical protein